MAHGPYEITRRGRKILAIHPNAIHDLDTHHLCCTDSDGREIVLQGEFGPKRAAKSLKILNDHELTNGRPAKFFVRPLC